MTEHPYEKTNRARLRNELCACITTECAASYSERVESDFRDLLHDLIRRELNRYAASPKVKAFAKDVMTAFDAHIADHQMAAGQLRDIAHNASLNMMQRARFDLMHGFLLDIVNGHVKGDKKGKERAMAILNEIDLNQDGRPDWKE